MLCLYGDPSFQKFRRHCLWIVSLIKNHFDESGIFGKMVLAKNKTFQTNTVTAVMVCYYNNVMTVTSVELLAIFITFQEGLGKVVMG